MSEEEDFLRSVKWLAEQMRPNAPLELSCLKKKCVCPHTPTCNKDTYGEVLSEYAQRISQDAQSSKEFALSMPNSPLASPAHHKLVAAILAICGHTVEAEEAIYYVWPNYHQLENLFAIAKQQLTLGGCPRKTLPPKIGVATAKGQLNLFS